LCKYLLYSTSTVCSKGTEPARFLSRALGKHSTRTVRVRVCTRLYSYEYSKCTVHNSVCNYILCSTADNPAERSSGQVRADTVLSSAKRSRRSPRASSPTMVSSAIGIITPRRLVPRIAGAAAIAQRLVHVIPARYWDLIYHRARRGTTGTTGTRTRQR
jgi:hypothetical protein